MSSIRRVNRDVGEAYRSSKAASCKVMAASSDQVVANMLASRTFDHLRYGPTSHCDDMESLSLKCIQQYFARLVTGNPDSAVPRLQTSIARVAGRLNAADETIL